MFNFSETFDLRNLDNTLCCEGRTARNSIIKFRQWFEVTSADICLNKQVILPSHAFIALRTIEVYNRFDFLVSLV